MAGSKQSSHSTRQVAGGRHSATSYAQFTTQPTVVESLKKTVISTRKETTLVNLGRPQYEEWHGPFEYLKYSTAYHEGPAKLVWTRNGERTVLALLLSHDYGHRMGGTFCSGSDYRTCKERLESVFAQLHQTATATSDYRTLRATFSPEFLKQLAGARAALEIEMCCIYQIAETQRPIVSAEEYFHGWLSSLKFVFKNFLVAHGLVDDRKLIQAVHEPISLHGTSRRNGDR